ncbi:MAG: YdcF family protein [Cytophagales bacterium]
MFFFLSKTINALIFPTTWLFVLLLWSLFKPKLRKKLLITSVILLLVYGNYAIANFCIKCWEGEATNVDNLEKHDLAVVLTGVTTESKDSNRVFFSRGADRITHAFQLWSLGKVEKILITGGKGGIIENEHEREEALKLKDFLLMCGMPDSLIITESKAKNTYENAKFTKELIDILEIKPRKILLITSAFHMKRSLACFKKQGLEVTPFSVDFYANNHVHLEKYLPFPSTEAMSKFDLLLKEVFGFMAYFLTGKI